jgi:hypothetical protein
MTPGRCPAEAEAPSKGVRLVVLPPVVTGRESTPHELRWGTTVTLTDVDEALVEQIRASVPRQPQVGHVVNVALQMDSKGDIWAYLEGGAPFGRLAPGQAGMYR